MSLLADIHAKERGHSPSSALVALKEKHGSDGDAGQGWDGGRHRGHSAWDYTHNHHSLHRTADHDETLQAARDGFKVRRRKRRRRQPPAVCVRGCGVWVLSGDRGVGWG